MGRHRGNAPHFNHQALVADYLAGMSLRQLAAKYPCTMQRAHQIVRKFAPNQMRKAGGYNSSHKWQAP